MGFGSRSCALVAILAFVIVPHLTTADLSNSTLDAQPQAVEASAADDGQKLEFSSNSTDALSSNTTQTVAIDMPSSYIDTLPPLHYVELNFTHLRTQLFQAENKVFRRLSARQLEVGIQELQELAAILDTILPQEQGRQVFIGLNQTNQTDSNSNTTELMSTSNQAAQETEGAVQHSSESSSANDDSQPTAQSASGEVISLQEQLATVEADQAAVGSTDTRPDHASNAFLPQEGDQQSADEGNAADPGSPGTTDAETASQQAVDATAAGGHTTIPAGLDSDAILASNSTGDSEADQVSASGPSNTTDGVIGSGSEEGQANATLALNVTAQSHVRAVRWAPIEDHAVIVGAEASAAALFDLAVLASTGVAEPHVKRDPLWAHLALHRAAAFDSLEAQMSLADRYFFGRGVKANCSIGMRFAKIAAKTVVAAAEKDASHIEPFMPVRLRERWMRADYFNHDEFQNSKAMVLMEEDMAGRGNVEAQRRLAYRRLVGQGVDADPAGAFRDFQAAAAQGDAYALFNLGFMYLRGLHVPVNTTTAKEYFEAAAKKGLAAGYNGVGVLHYNGHGMPRNITAAKEAFEKGAALDNPDCLFNLGTLYQNYELNNSRALHYYERAYTEGHWRAGYNLALLHDNSDVGKGCETAQPFILEFIHDKKNWQHEMKYAVKGIDYGDHFGALVRYLIVAEQGSEVAASNAAWMLLQGQGYTGARAGDLAASLLKRSASYNSSEGLVQLGNLCLEDEPQLQLQAHQCTAEQAAQLYAKAAEMGSVEGMLSLAWVHWHGLGVEANTSRAGELYRVAYKMSSWYQDGMAAVLALWGFRLGSLLSLLMGKGVVLQLLDAVVSMHQEAAFWVAAVLSSEGGAGEGLASSLSDLGASVQWMSQEMQADPEIMTIGVLLGALVFVLWLRRNQQAQLQQRQMAQQFFTMPEAEQDVPALQQQALQDQQPRQGQGQQLPQALLEQPQQQPPPQPQGIGLVQPQ